MMGYLDAWDLVLATISEAGRTDLLENLKELEIHDGPDLDLALDWANAAGISLSDEIERTAQELVADGDLEPEALEAFE
ncbi:hypothetical protein [uncultured Varibaculum sp.]|uniref:hypothetical protein n=1 Tax=uncultured Varibaculum sp. TaxID=413896 RepID=UPI0027D9BC40|nr:hypothetical protein [uncultured Varibaculum sp.]